MSGTPFIYRFEHDLRLEDHAGLAAAAQHRAGLPVCSRSNRTLEALAPFAAPRGVFLRRGAFAGCRLARVRQPADGVSAARRAAVCSDIAQSIGAGGVAWSAGPVETDARLQSRVEEAGLRAVVVHDAPAIAQEETAAHHTGGGDGYRSFGPYFDVWSDVPIVSYEHPLLMRFAEAPVDGEPLPQPRSLVRTKPEQEAGAARARASFDAFCPVRSATTKRRRRMPWMTQTSRLSADLSFGTIAARTIALENSFATRRSGRCNCVGALGTRAFLRSIARRDFSYN